jgi:hypothetical protein
MLISVCRHKLLLDIKLAQRQRTNIAAAPT